MLTMCTGIILIALCTVGFSLAYGWLAGGLLEVVSNDSYILSLASESGREGTTLSESEKDNPFYRALIRRNEDSIESIRVHQAQLRVFQFSGFALLALGVASLYLSMRWLNEAKAEQGDAPDSSPAAGSEPGNR